ncbi:hypothetical protein ACFV4F_32990 [Kitasatospora sp. NPDC059722]|uniref:hypothetical protein n=1 Tax=unclassified Kitasatospora TaxID=2633591 RepID=UPI003660DCF3
MAGDRQPHDGRRAHGDRRDDDAAGPLARLDTGEPDDLFDGRDERGPRRKGEEQPYGGDDDLYGASAAVAGVGAADVSASDAAVSGAEEPDDG